MVDTFLFYGKILLTPYLYKESPRDSVNEFSETCSKWLSIPCVSGPWWQNDTDETIFANFLKYTGIKILYADLMGDGL